MNIFSIFASTSREDVEATPKRFNMVLRHRMMENYTTEFLNDLF
jgi:hypothetical protein